MKFIRSMNDIIGKLEASVAMLLFFSLAIVGIVGISYRYVFQSGIIWADELMKNMLLWLALLGGSLATRDKKHIKIDIFPILFEGRKKIALGLDAITQFSAFIICLFLTWAGWSFVTDMRAMGEFNYLLHCPMWVLQVIMPLAYLIIAFRFALHSIEDVLHLMNGGAK